MVKKEWKKVFNLNSYEWWRNHRRVVTFGGFLILFAWYISPLIQSAKDKNNCINMIADAVLAQGYYTEIKNKNHKALARAEAYVVCGTSKRPNMR